MIEEQRVAVALRPERGNIPTCDAHQRSANRVRPRLDECDLPVVVVEDMDRRPGLVRFNDPPKPPGEAEERCAPLSTFRAWGVEPTLGFEPRTCCLRNSCSTAELCRRRTSIGAIRTNRPFAPRRSRWGTLVRAVAQRSEQMMSVGGDEPDPVEGSWPEPTVWLPRLVCYLCPTGGSIAV